MTRRAPAAFLFTAASLPLFGAGLGYHQPLDPRDGSVPCFLHSTDHDPLPLGDDVGEDVRDVAPAFVAGLEDVGTVLRANRAFAERLGLDRRPSFHVGFDAVADAAQVRAWFVKARVPVLDAAGLLRERRALRDARAGEAYQHALRKRGGATPREAWARARDYLLGGGDRPALEPDDHGTFRVLPGLLREVSPVDWDEVQRRALDLVVQVPTLLARVERSLALDDPTHDAFHSWRELLAARGVGDDTVEALAVATWAHPASVLPGGERSPRAWWILARAGADLDGFLQRNAGVERVRLLERLFVGATAVWQAPPFRAVAEAVLARCGDELPTHAIDHGLRWHSRVVAPLVLRHADKVLRGRSEAQQRSLRALLER